MVLTAFVFFTVNTLDGEELVLAKLLKLNVVVLSLLPNILPLLVPAKKETMLSQKTCIFSKTRCKTNVKKLSFPQRSKGD